MSICSDPVACLNGNCIGCKDGAVWCQDPRCAPNCPGETCTIPDDHDFNGNLVFLIILACLFTMLVVYWFVYGPPLLTPHNDHARAGVIVPQ